ncbi:chromosome partitioning protein ParA [Pseudoalteromonas mariniglutinosa]|uniref:chromosome partitioning protein ParA n=1 Tax=Pseudoalteromonas mariniglutinosa TaxID=206042 RepID=UPI003850F5C0
MTQNNRNIDDAILPMCRESVDNAMSYVNEHRKTIAELINLQLSLQQQLTQIQGAAKDHLTEQEQTAVNELNDKLAKSHKLIRKLKTDLESSMGKLKVTRQKLYAQYDAVETLQKEKQQLKEQFDQLQKEAALTKESVRLQNNNDQEKSDLLNTLNSYKRQIAEQDQLLQQLQLQEEAPQSDDELQTLKQELEKTQHALKHLSKEKKFIESRYLEIIKKNT